MTAIWYHGIPITRRARMAAPDEYRADVCTELRETFGRPDLADVVAGWSDEHIRSEGTGYSPCVTARRIVRRGTA